MSFLEAYRPETGLSGRTLTSPPGLSSECNRSQKAVPQIFQLERLNDIDLYEITINPYVEAVIEVNPDAVKIAAGLDDERVQGKTRGPLHGVPVLVKDNIATKDKMQTTAGSWALLGSIVPRDAYIVTQLRNAGAIILGHANMSEWASVRSKEYSEGYSPRGGQVRNPFDLSRTPFGSSSGSAVAVSANIVPISFGTETDSSIVGPAQINSVVGIKPTPGLTSRSEWSRSATLWTPSDHLAVQLLMPWQGLM
ncbi:MAG: hypothetical protein LQ350_004515 [Teloschistes chrysophthalmus]|nr:MAG: hypothetical protein LQ350_004515 [Niorma chrysophthalma]